jgi:hypothetical protein
MVSLTRQKYGLGKFRMMHRVGIKLRFQTKAAASSIDSSVFAIAALI